MPGRRQRPGGAGECRLSVGVGELRSQRRSTNPGRPDVGGDPQGTGDPGPNGVKYQIMNMEVQDGQGPFATGYASFSDYLSSFVGDLEAGRFTVDDWGLTVD